MRLLIIVVLIGLILTIAGVLHFRSDDNEIAITVDKSKAESVIDRGKEIGNEAAGRARDAVNEIRGRDEE